MNDAWLMLYLIIFQFKNVIELLKTYGWRDKDNINHFKSILKIENRQHYVL